MHHSRLPIHISNSNMLESKLLSRPITTYFDYMVQTPTILLKCAPFEVNSRQYVNYRVKEIIL